MTLRALGPLRCRHDLQSLAYLAAQPLLMGWQWLHGFNPAAFLASLFLAVGVSVIHHNHAHLPMWTRRGLNRGTDLVITVLQGHPACAMHPAHRRNHHRFRHGPQDAARTWRFGDHNHFAGWMLHPMQAAWAVYPLVLDWLFNLRHRRPAVWRWYLVQYVLWMGIWLGLLLVDPVKALMLVIVPQLFGLHWLLAANYLQHAHADDGSRYGYARNFEGWLNPLLFNIGLHTAHHEHGRAHWSRLPQLQRRYRACIEPRLLEPSFWTYVIRVFLLAPFLPRYRSRSLRGIDTPPAVFHKDC